MPRTHSLVLYLATVLRDRTRVFGVDARPWFVVDVSLRVRRRVSRPGDAFRHCRRVLGAQCVSSSSSCSRPRIHVASCRVLVELRRTPSTPSPTHSCPSPSVPHVRHTMRLGGHGHHVLDGHGENRRIRPIHSSPMGSQMAGSEEPRRASVLFARFAGSNPGSAEGEVEGCRRGWIRV